MILRHRIACSAICLVAISALAGCGGGSSSSAGTGEFADDTAADSNENTPIPDINPTPMDTDSMLADVDMDGQLNADENTCGSDPNDVNSVSTDTDGDSIPDCVDLITDTQVSANDSDGDGQSDINETACASDPNSALSFAADTDSDGIPDCVEIASNLPNDSDGDGQLNDQELACGSDPEDSDSLSPDANADSRPDCLAGYPVLPISGQAGETVDCNNTLPCTWINSENNIRIKLTYMDSRDSSIDENESDFSYNNLEVMYEVSSDIDTELTFLDTATFSDTQWGVSELRSQRFLNLSTSASFGSEVVALLAGTTMRVLGQFNDGVKGQGSMDTLTLPFLRNALRFEAVFKNTHFGRVNNLDKDCQNLLPCTWISPDGTTEITLTSLGLNNLANLRAEFSVITRRDGITLTLHNLSRGVGSDLSSYSGNLQRFDQVNDLTRNLVNAILLPGETRTATVEFNESPNSTLQTLVRLSLDTFETIPLSPDYEENSSNWNRFRAIQTPRLDPVFRNIPLVQ